jgi:signal peptidase I
MRRLLPVAAVGLILVGCGGSGGSTSVVLRPTDPRLANLYVQVRGTPAVTKVLTRSLSEGAGSSGRLVVVPATHGRKVCSRTIPIDATSATAPGLRKFAGQKFTIAVYGDGNFDPAVCRGLRTVLFLAGGDRKVYRIASSAMEPTLHCARPAPGCRGRVDDLVVARLTGATNIQRRDILVFTTPPEAAVKCGEGGTFVKRVIGLPGETVHENRQGSILIKNRGSSGFVELDEPYVPAQSRLADSQHFGETWHVPSGDYFMLGDNRAESCDSRVWGAVPPRNVIGPVVQVFRQGRALRPR